MAIPAVLAKKIAEARSSQGGGNRIKDGNYVLVVKQIICDSMHSGVMYIPEFDVLECEKVHDTIDPNKVGSDCSCAWPMDAPGNAGTAAKGNIKQFFCSLLGLDDSAPEFQEKLGQFAGPKGSEDALRARGMLITCSTKRKKISTGQNAGKEGCFPFFGTVGVEEGNSPSEIAARAASLK